MIEFINKVLTQRILLNKLNTNNIVLILESNELSNYKLLPNFSSKYNI